MKRRIEGGIEKWIKNMLLSVKCINSVLLLYVYLYAHSITTRSSAHTHTQSKSQNIK